MRVSPAGKRRYHGGMNKPKIRTASRVEEVRYEIRGRLARRAHELERDGHDVLHLNVGNPGAFGLHAPETMRQAVVRNLQQSDPYGPQTGIFPAREAVAIHFQEFGLPDTRFDQVMIGNGVSELVDLSLRALLEPDDEVLVPAPDYPLWTAATVLNGGKAVHWCCSATRSTTASPTTTPGSCRWPRWSRTRCA